MDCYAKAHWQNCTIKKKLSRSFRELNYGQTILSFPLNKPLLEENCEQLVLQSTIQSNGKICLYQRPNYLQCWIPWKLGCHFKPWIRLRVMKKMESINNKIYIGNRELDLSYAAIIVMPSLNTSILTPLKYGGMQLNYVFPIESSSRSRASVSWLWRKL
jgi:outer membrane phospholipase A